jgi:hypothetical protein
MNRAARPAEWSKMSNLEPEIRSAIESRIDQELARRAIAGSMVYFALCGGRNIHAPLHGPPVALVLAGSLTLLQEAAPLH